RAGQFAAQPGQQLVARQAGVTAEFVDILAADRLRQIAFRNVLVRSLADPGVCSLALAVLLKLVEQTTKSAAEDAAGRASREQPAEAALQQSAKSAAARRAKSAAARRATSAAQHAAENVAQAAAATLRAAVHRI